MKVEGIEELRRRMGHSQFLLDPLEDMLNEGVKIGQKASVKAVDGGLGKAVRTVGTSVDSPKHARVYTAMAPVRARQIEIGRKRGTDPRSILKGIYQWKAAVGASATAWQIATAIQKRGTPGKRFMVAGREAVEQAMPILTAQLGQKMERWFNRP